ncbi:MAG: GPR endopeptidase [Desulfitobacteriaceae bacterium]|nr:GPR endopeptidase [Desulfitobacteriaceae bacterium]MDD4754005.1 GPR endopeptidase [Desulfitobacteriaceae bacterium]
MRTVETLKKIGVSLDLAVEAHELLRGATKKEIPGVQEDIESFDHAKVTTVTILNNQGENIMGKPVGTYITIEAPEIRFDKGLIDDLSIILKDKISSMLKIDPQGTVLVIGLGNWNATPDALGPHVVNSTMATRHLFRYAPETIGEGLRPICTLAPGVLGITGIETAEIIKGVVDRVKPDCIIAVDALAAANISRLGTTVQIANTGINPGSGLGNNRLGINQQSMGVPVIAIGVPTVVYASTIVNEALAKLNDIWSANMMTANCAQNIKPELSKEINSELFAAFEGNLVVTPKEVDDIIINVSKVIAAGVTQALHGGINQDNYHLYLQ